MTITQSVAGLASEMKQVSASKTWGGSIGGIAAELADLDKVQRNVAMGMAKLSESERKAILEMIEGVSVIRKQTISHVAERTGIDASTLAKAANAKETDKMTAANLRAALSSNDLSDSQKDSIRALLSYIATEKAATASTETLKAVTVGFWTALKTAIVTNPFGWIVTLVSLLPTAINFFGQFIDSSEEMIEAGKEVRETYLQAQEAFATNTKTVNELEDEFNALSKGVDENGDNISLTQEEYSRYLEIIDSLVQISPQIVQGYDNEGKAILNYKDAIKETRDELEKLNQAEIDSYLGREKADKIFSEANAEQKEARKSLNKKGGKLGSLLNGRFWELDKTVAWQDAFKAANIGWEIGIDKWTDSPERLVRIYENMDVVLAELQKTGAYTTTEIEDIRTEIRGFADDVQALNNNAAKQQWIQTWAENSDWYKNIPTDAIAKFNEGLAKTARETTDVGTAQSKAKTYADSFLKLYSSNYTKTILDMAEGLKDGTVALEDYNNELNVFKIMNTGNDEAKSALIEYFESLSNAAQKSAGVLAASEEEARNAIEQNRTTIEEVVNIADMLSKAYSEVEASGSVTAETYRELTGVGEDFADIFTFANGKIEISSDKVRTLAQKLVDEKGAALAANGATEAQIAVLGQLMARYSEVDTEITKTNDDIKSSAKTLLGVIDDMNDGIEYSTLEMLDLIEQYPELESGIEKTTTGYKVQIETVKELIQQLGTLYNANQRVANTNYTALLKKSNNPEIFKNIDSIFALFEEQTGNVVSSLEDFESAYREYHNDASGLTGVSDEYLAYVKEEIANRNKNSFANEIANDLADLDNGYVEGYKPDTSESLVEEIEEIADSIEEAETEFERAYKHHQHLLAMDQETVEQYLTWLDGAYQQAYAAGEMGLDDYYKYQEEVYEKTQEVFDASLADMKHQIDQLSHQEGTSAQIAEIYKQMQEKVHAQADKYRSIGLAENHDLIEALQDQWWEYEDAIRKIREDDFNDYLNNSKFAIDVLKTNNADTKEIIDSWKSILSSINDEIAYYTSVGYKETSDVVQSLMKEAKSAKDAIIEAIDEVVDKVNELVDGVRGVYDTLTSAAKEYASTGYLSVDSLQSILELAPKYLDFLYDENGQLVLNEESIQKVIAAKTEEMAVETALAYAKKVLNAAEQGDIEALRQLADVTAEGSKSTWDMVYATLGLAKATGVAKGMEESYFDDAVSYVTKMQSLTQTAVNTISEYYKTLDDNYVSQADALQKILELTEDMIKQENEDQVEAIEKEKELYNDIVDRKKESLKLSQDQEKHDRDNADKLKEIAKLQSRIEQLSLDDSREAQAQKRQLEEELYEKQKELADSQSDYSIETQTDALDREYEAYEDEKDKEIDALKETLNSAEKLYQAAITRINNGWDSLYDDLIGWNSEYGTLLSDELTSAWNSATAAVQRYGSFVEALNGVGSHTNLGTNSAPTKDPAAATSVVDKMKRNSLAWFTATGSDQAALNAANVELAGEYSLASGDTLTKKNGAWYRSDGSQLYSLSKDDVCHAIVDAMKANSAAWNSASESRRSELEAENITLAKRLEDYLGVKLEKTRSGVWMLNGQPLYEKYHTGGIVGGNSTKKQDEVLALLEKGEAVLDKTKQEGLYKLVDIAEAFSKSLGKKITSSQIGTLMSNIMDGVPMNSRLVPAGVDPRLAGASNNSFEFAPVVSVSIQHNGELTDASAREYGKTIADNVLGRLSEAFTKKGVTNPKGGLLK